jgi:hypothetical protein
MAFFAAFFTAFVAALFTARFADFLPTPPAALVPDFALALPTVGFAVLLVRLTRPLGADPSPDPAPEA